MPKVPLELSDFIIDFLHNDARSLAVCARVCRAWAPAARFHLFRSIVLQNHKLSSSFQRLLGSRPELGLYVRHLTVAKLTTAADVFLPAKPSSSAEDTDAFPHVFDHLPHLRSLTLAHMDLKDVKELRSLRHASLTDVTLSYCQFADFADIVDLVNSFPRLATLSLAGLTWKEELRPPAARPIPSLTSLALVREVYTERLFEWLVAAGLHTSITALVARCASEADTDLFGPFLKLAGPTLRELDLDWSFTGDKTIELPPTVSLAACSALESLHLRFPVHYSTSVPWVVSLLSTLPTQAEEPTPAPSIRALTLEVRLLGGLAALDWDGLNAVLAAPAFRTLGALNVSVNLWPGVHRDMAEVEGVVRERLAPFAKRGVVQVTKI
ncbi:hypothetical protein C2E23DRAFT_719362 [Lenzites betulinus]|nr:hypothetical protein C2E23DRAFT_719362 [Lenzites betulinus]